MDANKERLKKGKRKHSAYKPFVPAVDQAAKILLFIAESSNSKIGLTEICNQIGIHKSKAYSILHTLMQHGFTEKDLQTKTYSLGPSLLFLSRNFLDNLYYPDIVAPFLESPAKETGGTAMFGLISGSHVFVVNRRKGNENIGFRLRIGQRLHMTLEAHGKAIVAFMDEKERGKLYTKKKLYFYGDPSRMDMKRLREEITKCKDLGFAQDIGEVTPGVNIVSAPVFGLQEKVIGCIILVGTFAERMIAEFEPKVTSIARQVSRKFGAHVGHVLLPS